MTYKWVLYSQAGGTVEHRLWVPTTRARQSRQDWHNTKYSFHSGWTSSMGFVRSAWLILHPTQWQGIQQTSSTVVHLYNEGRNWAPHGRLISFNDVNSHRYLWLIESYPAEEGSQRSFQSAQFNPHLLQVAYIHSFRLCYNDSSGSTSRNASCFPSTD